ncbi:rifin [Plasmodium falciparum NF54]|uniref:Rifin n=2 Tax=Plasmodium falciparum TaxID=5833 RepID=Q8IJ08_PLAF7|nr:rifin [Plasmodium falciparum 3D7]KAF4330843.1 rifin [Plasmodium falciparum NF54]PKC43600.1 rifin [Plasmodium falciparum NF54]CZT98656.1 rifin [Plasmodium falciparum 3D7]|eukprot:XP_001347678.1 rifin [Plasmodium falciparum 3D7]
MKMRYSEILFFSLSLNILITSSYAHNKNKIYIKSHTPTNTSRVLSECDMQTSNYDNDPDMKSVKENFERQTSQRFEEYEERMQEKRRKCKEQCDKDIQQIIVKDKIKKSLDEKVEKVCLKCGCGLGGVGASIGIFGAIAVSEVTKAATAAAVQNSIETGIATVVSELHDMTQSFLKVGIDIVGMINKETYRCPQALTTSIYAAKQEVCVGKIGETELVCNQLGQGGTPIWFGPKVLQATTEGIKIAKTTEDSKIALINAESSHLYSAIGYSVLAIFIIVLVMVIIYLFLRYRRKKKMNKKLQYTKLLNK